MMDESNEKTNKSCIILIRIIDFDVGDVRTKFIDMPVVNIGTAVNLFNALKLFLIKMGLSFDNCIVFMSDNTNVMKGARSGAQKLIHNECPNLYDVGCICHLADLTIKAGMNTLPIDVDQRFVDVFYFFCTAGNESSNMLTTGIRSFHLSQPLLSNIAPLGG